MTHLEVPKGESLRDVIRDFSGGLDVTDDRFDSIFPDSIRQVSLMHWTPVEIARRAAQLLYVGEKTRVLDIGSGAGKFCMVAALTTPGQFTGVEQRPHLVELSRELALFHGIPRVNFIQAKMEEIDWKKFTGFYLFNPFIENLYDDSHRIDRFVDFNQDRYVDHVKTVQKKLEELPAGSRIVTYHGFGGVFPPDYLPIVEERWGEDELVLWERIV